MLTPTLRRQVRSTTPASMSSSCALGLISAVIMEALDTTIINVALPQMAGNLGATPNEIGWVSTGYILPVVIILPEQRTASVARGRLCGAGRRHKKANLMWPGRMQYFVPILVFREPLVTVNIVSGRGDGHDGCVACGKWLRFVPSVSSPRFLSAACTSISVAS